MKTLKQFEVILDIYNFQRSDNKDLYVYYILRNNEKHLQVSHTIKNFLKDIQKIYDGNDAILDAFHLI